MSTLTEQKNQTATPRNGELVAAAVATKANADTRRDIIAIMREDAAKLEAAAVRFRAGDFVGTAKAFDEVAANMRANADRLEGLK